MSDSKHTAIGQALGYMYQFDRATYRLLEADTAVVSVGLEQIDDVIVHRAGLTVREQDKATQKEVARPLTDRSVALWKTLAIWSDVVRADPAVLVSTEFHLVTNGQVAPDSLAARINAAKTAEGTLSVATEICTMLPTLRGDLQPFAERLRLLPLSTLEPLVGKIFVFDGVSASFGGNLDKLASLRLLGNIQRAAVFDNAVGWVRRVVLEKAKRDAPTLIDRAAFDREIRALFRRVAV